MVWSLIIRRNLKDHEESQFISLLNLLNGVFIPNMGEDTRVWTTSKDGLFSVSSFFSAILNRLWEKNVVGSIWKIKGLPRVVMFGWLAIRKRILTRDNLRRRGG